MALFSRSSGRKATVKAPSPTAHTFPGTALAPAPWARCKARTRKSRGKPRLFVCLIPGGKLERVRRFERPTPTLARLCSTPELHPLARPWAASRAYMAEERGDCNREMTVFLERILPAATSASKASKRRGTGAIANPRARPPLLCPELLRRPCPDATVGRKRHDPF